MGGVGGGTGFRSRLGQRVKSCFQRLIKKTLTSPWPLLNVSRFDADTDVCVLGSWGGARGLVRVGGGVGGLKPSSVISRQHFMLSLDTLC